MMHIYISGVHGGINPSPGIGVARSRRAAYPHARLAAVDYSPQSSGLFWTDFDECVIRPPWHAIDLKAHVAYVESRLSRGAIWISGLDLEIQLLASRIRTRSRLPLPPPSAIKMAGKPPFDLAAPLRLSIPPALPVGSSSEEELSRFCRLHGWPLWVKGIHYDAVPVWSWYEVKPVLSQLAYVWGGTHRVFLQAHVAGQDVTVAFAAWKGELLGAAFLEKLDRTQQGKVWSGRVQPVPHELESRLRALVRATRWSGGGEIECVRDPHSQLWLLECNPRFPAWIYGATQAGYNLPALLIEAMTGESGKLIKRTRQGTFTRVVLEVPASAS
jgi:hypothetical protein